MAAGPVRAGPAVSREHEPAGVAPLDILCIPLHGKVEKFMACQVVSQVKKPGKRFPASRFGDHGGYDVEGEPGGPRATIWGDRSR